MRPVSAARARGFTYLGVLFIISVLGLTAAMASVVWSFERQRENERQLKYAGRQFVLAFELYRQRASAPAMQYPRDLKELLRDARGLKIEHPLRRIYIDPMMGDPDWGLVRLPDGGIVGVYSRSTRETLASSERRRSRSAGPAETYRDWRFMAPGAEALLAPATSASAANPGSP